MLRIAKPTTLRLENLFLVNSLKHQQQLLGSSQPQWDGPVICLILEVALYDFNRNNYQKYITIK